MKILLAASMCCLAMTSASQAATVTVSGNSPPLAGVPAATIALLLDAGVKPKNAGGGLLTVEVKNFHCDQHSNAAVDASSVSAGLPTLKCRINSRNQRGTTAGQPFGEGRAMADLLKKVQDLSGVAFTDCAMGYCGTFAQISCVVDTRIDNFSDGQRWICIYADGQ